MKVTKMANMVLSSVMALGLAGLAQAQSVQQLPAQQMSAAKMEQIPQSVDIAKNAPMTQSHQSMGESKSKAQEKTAKQMKKSEVKKAEKKSKAKKANKSAEKRMKKNHRAN